MDLKQRLESCKKCQNREFSEFGIVCSLSGSKPDFNNSCASFALDPKQAHKMHMRQQYEVVAKEENKNQIWVVIGVALIVLRIIFRFLRD
ncbi:hypothetical protein [Flavobacterium sp. ASW18X]|uniref:hypothetical protein n=1 Tax=Flavobacterium sp. ASW18X TaxID=2572595 RepID=UPI0010AEE72F|nr:hypothetical protein [Flavobacterium sp. ASW18X]TKD58966.1 hypothetical protein FBT53_14980 [Flavobacterium sp. ASW18X]